MRKMLLGVAAALMTLVVFSGVGLAVTKQCGIPSRSADGSQTANWSGSVIGNAEIFS